MLNIIEHGDNTFYELCLTVTVPRPHRHALRDPAAGVDGDHAHDPVGLLGYEDEGLTQASPMIVNTAIGSSQTVSVPLVQGVDLR